LHRQALVRTLEQTRPGAERRADRVVEPPAQHVVPARRPGHRDDLAVDELVTLSCLALEAQVLGEVDGPACGVCSHETL
jgi:hypothetical protein